MSNPHDALFRYVFTQPEHAASALKGLLPEEVSRRLDWGSLKAEPSTFVDERLRGREADVLLSVRCEGRRALVYVLLEHQSSSDHLMTFRLLRYVVRIWEAFLSEQPGSKKLPAILPVVVHHSEQGWSAPQDLSALIDLEPSTLEAVSGYLPQFRFLLEDLTDADDRRLRGRSMTAVAATALMLLSRGRRTPDLMGELSRWSDLLAEVAEAKSGLEALAALLGYALRVGEVEPGQLRQFASGLGPTAEEAYMTAAEKLTAESYARGRTEGKAEGKAEGRAEGRTEGKAEGRTEGKAEVLARLLKLKFGGLPESVRERVSLATVPELDGWTDRVIVAQSLDEVFE